MITGKVLRDIARKGGKVYTLSFPAGPTTPAFTNHYATQAQCNRDYFSTKEAWPDSQVTRGVVPAASLDLSAFILV